MRQSALVQDDLRCAVRGCGALVWIVGLSVTGLIVLAGCDGGDSGRSSTPPRPTSAPSTAPAVLDPGAAGVLKPYFAKGRVVGQDGKPITAPDARIVIRIQGDVDRTPVVDSDGYYVEQVPEGSYRPVSARIEVPFRGRDYTFSLEPSATPRAWDARDGVVQNFVWKVSGLRPGQREDETRPEPWYGGSITAKYGAYREDLKRAVPSAPPETRVVFTVTPEGDQVDGKPGTVKTFERKYDLLIGLHHPLLPDLPLAWYRVSGQEVYPDGRHIDLLFWDPEQKRWAGSTPVWWVPSKEENGLEPTVADFTRPIAPGQ